MRLRAGLRAFALLSFALSALTMLPASGRAQTGYFRFQVCNHSRTDADVAIHGLTFTGWELSGWYRVPAFQCRDLGIYRIGLFDTFARSIDGSGQWDGYSFPSPWEVRLCLQYPGPFKRSTGGTRSDVLCRPDERLHYMRSILVTQPLFTWDLLGPR